MQALSSSGGSNPIVADLKNEPGTFAMIPVSETCAFEGKSGTAICAQGVLRAINRGLRSGKLKIDFKTHAEEEPSS